MKTRKNLLVCILICFVFFTATACKPSGESVSRDSISIWSAKNTEKVLQDKEYTSAKGGMNISVEMFKNEHEGAQIIITPTVNISSYIIETADLINSSDANAKIEKSQVEVFNQKYIEVIRSSANALPLGMYPDAILPFEAAISHRENNVKANQNQAIYFNFKTNEETKAGTYLGSYKLTVSGNVFDVPVSVEVYDYTLSEKVNTKTSFGIHRYWGEGGIVSAEKDSSWEMYAAYYDYLLEHRISSRYLPAAMGDIDGFITQLKKYSKDEKFSNYIIPYIEKYDETDTFGLKRGIDYALYEKYLWAIAEASIAENKNLFEKASTYFAMFDEAQTAPQIATANHILKKVYALQERVAIEMRQELTCDATLKSQIVGGLLNINQLFVTSYQDSFTVGATYCPDIRKYNQEEDRKKYDMEYVYNQGTENEYKQNVDKWWYGFLVPNTPMPTYHIDDYLYSSRIMSWMQYNYDIVGNLYWSSTFFLKTNKGVNEPIQDYYDTALRFIGNQNDGSNGDGFLLYPGNPYDIYGPVGSLRLESIRDGMEEYDLLHQLETAYNETAKTNAKNINFDSVAAILYQKLYNGTVVSTNSDTFLKVRNELAQLLVLSDKTGVSILDSTIKGTSREFKVYVPNGKNIETNAQSRNEGNGIYTLTMDLVNNANELTLSCEGYSLNLDLGGKVSQLSGETLKSIVSIDGTGTANMVSGEDIDFDGQVLRLNMAATDKVQGFSLVSENISQLGEDADRILISAYNDSSSSVTMQLYIVNKDGLATPISRVTLKPGWNNVSYNISTIKWSAIGGVSKLKFDIGVKSENVERVLYLDNVTFISKSR